MRAALALILSVLNLRCSFETPDYKIGATECGWTEFVMYDLEELPDTECVRVTLLEGDGVIIDERIRPCEARANEVASRCAVGLPSQLHGYGPDNHERVSGIRDSAALVDGRCPLSCD